jgi:hypothetical protein
MSSGSHCDNQAENWVKNQVMIWKLPNIGMNMIWTSKSYF